MASDFLSNLGKGKPFHYSIEAIPGRGTDKKEIDEIYEFARKAAEYKKVHSFALTDSPGGNPRLTPDNIGRELMKTGLDIIIHLACKDRNRNDLESRAYQLNSIGLNNILALTGDYDIEGYGGIPKPVFDYDSVLLTKLLKDMNRGLEIPGRKPGTMDKLSPTNFSVGVAVSPFKQQEAEVMSQYLKLFRKIRSGADYVVTQLGYNSRKFDELIRFMRENNLDVPLIGYIYVPLRGVAQTMNKNLLPGSVVTDEMMAKIEKESETPDKGKGARIDRAAKQVAILRGLGYSGAHIGGFLLKFEQIVEIIEKSEEFFKNWQEYVKETTFEMPNEWYYYKYDARTGLNTGEWSHADSAPDHKAPLNYKIFRFLHWLMFTPDTVGFYLNRVACRFLDKPERKSLLDCVYFMEKIIKSLTNECKECGDCSLPEMAFLCPESQCGKFLRNGQCGGSYKGQCEVYPEKPCVWVKIYNRLKAYGEQGQIRDNPLVARNWKLYETSSWMNFYLGKDHAKAE
jgi:methylenetetrahydrofolate reductase (NADPH)